MQLPLYQIDAFTEKVFGGNPAAVVPLQSWLSDDLMLKIAQENAIAETAFYIEREEHIDLRWFTPEIEMDLCGHATLATAHCLYKYRGYEKDPILFRTNSGELNVTRKGGRYVLDLPRRVPEKASLPSAIADALSLQPNAVWKARDYLLIYDHEEEIANLKVEQSILDQINLDPGGVIVSAPGQEVDFVSRFFTPQASILEDPVTGSAHCTLIPYWAQQLSKRTLLAWQISARGGVLHCEDRETRVLVAGKARTYSIGTLHTD